MKIILFGAGGTIGREVLQQLRKDPDDEVISVSKSSGDYTVDISDPERLQQFFQIVRNFDTLISIAGHAYFGSFQRMTEADMYFGIKNKMMGQINMVMIGKEYVRNNGSFTLTSGFLSNDPIKGGVNYSMVNAAIEGFVKGAAIELDRGIRINAVSPGNVNSEAFHNKQSKFNPGQLPVSMEKVVAAYVKAAKGFRSGQIYRVWEPSTQFVD